MSIPALKTIAGSIMVLCLAPAAAQAGSIETVASFYAGQTHLDLEVFHASDGDKLGMLTIENPLRIRGQPTASIVIQKAQWQELMALWTKARAGITGAEPWTPVGELTEVDGSPNPPRLNISSGPDVRFAFGQGAIALAFELSAKDVEAMEQALVREQTMLNSRK